MGACPSLSLSAIVVRSENFIEAEVDGEVVALHVDKGTCYGLNKVGTRVWQQIASPARIGDICATLLREYKIDQATCEREVLDLLEELRAEGMIGVQPDDAAA